MRLTRAVWAGAATIACALLLASPVQAGVATTKHNLSASGPGTVKATTEAQICVFCHAPHNSSPSAPLWNRKSPTSAYTPYTSSTEKSTAGQPTGSSLVCLSCHDGTIALGQVLNRTTAITMAGGVTTIPATSTSHLGTDLSGDHPISFPYTSALATARGELADPGTLTGAVRLEDKAAGVMWLQIPAKSMLMNVKVGQRMVDGCQHATQRAASMAVAAAGTGLGIVAPGAARSASA